MVPKVLSPICIPLLLVQVQAQEVMRDFEAKYPMSIVADDQGDKQGAGSSSHEPQKVAAHPTKSGVADETMALAQYGG